jgi:hypothetical protein
MIIIQFEGFYEIETTGSWGLGVGVASSIKDIHFYYNTVQTRTYENGDEYDTELFFALKWTGYFYKNDIIQIKAGVTTTRNLQYIYTNLIKIS